MGVEIERKFLVVADNWREQAQRSQRLVQGYLTTLSHGTGQPERRNVQEKPHSGGAGTACSVRVRIGGNSAWLSIKSAVAGIERREYEYAIPLTDAERMLGEFCPARVEKIRHYVRFADAMFEVDEFLGENTGLVVAELELQSQTDEFPRPSWLGLEVSDRPRYYNANLLRHPYSSWNARERAGV